MRKIFELKFGSHLYGTDTPNSDLDLKGIYLPTDREIILHTYKGTIATSRPKRECERNNKDDVDMEFFSLDRYLDLLVEGQTVALDVLFAPRDMYTFQDPCLMWIMDRIYENRFELLNKNVNAFVGYARQQAAKYGIKGSRMDALKRVAHKLDIFYVIHPQTKLLHHAQGIEDLVKECSELISLEKTPLVEIVMLKGPKGEMDAPHLSVNGRNIPFHATVKYAREIVGKMLDGYGQRAHKAHLAGGVDWKALSHAVRVNNEAKELLETGQITFPRPDRELLLQIKTGQLPPEQVFEMIEQGLQELYIAQEKSTLREEPNRAWADDFVCEIYKDIVMDMAWLYIV
jgi:predicted nucleotidyltransferase